MWSFWASGDLTARKLIPRTFQPLQESIYHKIFVVMGEQESNDGLMISKKRVIEKRVFWRKKLSSEEASFIKGFLHKTFYHRFLWETMTISYAPLANRFKHLNEKFGTAENYIFYLSTPPTCMSRSQKIYEEGLTRRDGRWKRIIVRKAFATIFSLGQKHFNEGLHKILSRNSSFNRMTTT